MADYRGLNIRFRGDSTEATKALNIISNEAKVAQGNLTGIDNAMKSMKTNGDALNSTLQGFKAINLGQALKDAQDKAQAYRDVLPELESRHESLRSRIDATKASLEELRNVQSNMGEFAIATDDGVGLAISSLEGQLNSLEEQERKTSAEIERTSVNIQTSEAAAKSAEAAFRQYAVSVDAGNTALGQFGRGATELGGNLESVGKSISTVGDKMSVVSGIALMTFGRSTISATEDFGNAMAQLGGYLDISGEQLSHMSDLALQWGKDTQFSATEAADAMNELAKGGMTQAQIEGGAMEATMQLAAAGELGMAQAAETAVQAIKVFGLEAEDATAVADALAGAANKSTAEVSDLAQGFSQIGGAANMAGWDLNEVTGAMALLADRGFSGAEAGTTLKTMLQRLASPTKKASETMADLGIQVYDSQGKMVDAMEVVQQFERALEGLTDEQRNKALLDIFGQRGINGMTALLDSTSASFAEYIEATEQAGYATEMAQARMGDLGWALEYMRGELETAKVSFGNALAPTIIEAANGIEGLLAWFNELDAGTQTQIANMALAVTAAGPVISIAGHLASGIGGVVKAVGEGATAISTFAEWMGEGATVSMALSETVEATGAALAGPLVLGAAAAVAAIAAVAGVVADLDAQHRELDEATHGLVSAMDAADEAFAAYAGGAETAAKSLSDLREETREAIKEQAELAATMREDWEQIGTDSAVLGSYVSEMERLSEGGRLTEAELGNLKNAVDQFNDTTGASVEILDEQTGKLSLNVQQLQEIAEAYRQQQSLDQAIEDKNRLLEEQAQLEAKRAQLVSDGAKAVEAENAVTDQYLKTLGNAPSAMSSVDSELQNLNVALQYNAQAIANAEEEIGRSEYVFTHLATAMAAAGVTGEQYASLTEQQLAEIAAAFDGTISSIAGKLAEFGVGVGGTGQVAVDSAREAASELEATADETASNVIGTASSAADEAIKVQKRANDAIITEQKRANDAEYKELQRSLDAAYKERQRQYDAEADALSKKLDKEYELLQRGLEAETDAMSKEMDAQYESLKRSLDQQLSALQSSLDQQLDALQRSLDQQYQAASKAYDAIYNARAKALDQQYQAASKAYDREYSQLKSKLDAEYKARQASYAAEESALKSSNSSRLSSMKSANDKEESALKKSLDSRYSELKSQLDAEYKAVQKANDKRLKEVKAEQAAETKAYKAETSARIKEMEREYKEQLKLLESGGDSRTGDIDAKIDALKSETEAERKEIEKREQAERRSELEKAVEKAKSRRKRQEAEKALTDYLAEIAQKDREEQRSLEIERLENQKSLIKEETDAKKDELRQQYEDRKAMYQEERAAELEALQAEQSERYDLIKEQLDAEEAAYKEANDNRLAQLKERNDAELAALKERHDAEEAMARDSASAAEAALKERHSAQLELLKASHEEQLAALKESNKAKLDNLKESNKDELAALKESNKAKLDALKQQQKDQVSAQKEANAAQIAAQKEANATQLADLKESNAAQLDAKKQADKDQLAEVKDSNKAQVDALRESQKEQLEILKQANEDQLQALKYAQEDQMTTLKNHLDDIVDAMKSGGGTAVETAKSTGDEVSRAVDETAQQTEERVNTLKGKLEGDEREIHTQMLRQAGETKTSLGTTAKETVGGVLNEFDWFKNEAGTLANQAGQNIDSGLGNGAANVSITAANIASGIKYEFDDLPQVGFDAGDGMLANLNAGMVSKWNNEVFPNLQNMAQTMKDMLGHSVPKLGPLHEGGRGEVVWGEDMVQNLIDGMTNKEAALAEQTRRMASIVEDEFSPTMGYRASVGYDVRPMVGALTSGIHEALRSGVPQQSGVTVVVNEMVVREEADIHRVSRELYGISEQARRRSI